MDSHWFGFSGSGSGPVFGMKQGNRPKFTNKPELQPFKKTLYRRRYVLWPSTYIKCLRYLYFSFKNPICWDVFVWPGSGSALVWLPGSVSGSALRLKSGSESSIKTNADPQHCQRLKNVLILPTQDGADPVWELGPGGVLTPRRRQADLAREVWPGAGGGRRNPGVPRQAGINVLTAFHVKGFIFVVFETVLGIRGILVRFRIRIRIRESIHLTIGSDSFLQWLKGCKKLIFFIFFSYNLLAGT